MKWKCKQSGTVIELPDYEYDNMIGHDGYELVTEPEPKAEKNKKPVAEDKK